VADHFDDPSHHARAVAMEKMIHSTPALSAGELERVSRLLEQLVAVVRERTGQHDPADPRPATITGAADGRAEDWPSGTRPTTPVHDLRVARGK
jgi:hypothetical protein